MRACFEKGDGRIKDELEDTRKVLKLSDVATIKTSKRVLTSDYKSKGVPFLKGSDLAWVENKVNLDDNTNYITKQKFDELRKKNGFPKKGDILVTGNGTIGKTYLVDANDEFYFKDGVLWVTDITYDNDFLYMYIRENVLSYVKKLSHGSTITNLNIETLRSLPIPQLDTEEQRKIGQFLSLIDDLIAHNEERAKGKQDMLRYYKDIVLGNQKSEYAFETKPLKNFLSNVVDKSTIENQYPLLTSSKSGIHLQSEYFNGDIVVKSTIGNKIIKRGQITYRSMSDTGSFTFNVQNIVDCGLVSSAYPVMNTHNINTLLLTYCLNDSLFFKRQLCSIKEGSTRMALSYSKLETMKINIMKDYDVQCKLINLLSGLENEISLINERVNNLKVMKQHYLNVIFK